MTRWLDRAEAWLDRHPVLAVAAGILLIVAAVIMTGHHPP